MNTESGGEREAGYVLRLVHQTLLSHDGDALDQARAVLATIGYLMCSAGGGLPVESGDRLSDETAGFFVEIGTGFFAESGADLPPHDSHPPGVMER